MKETHRNRTFNWLEFRKPGGTGQSAGCNPEDPQEQDIQQEGEDIHLAGMQETHRNRTFWWLECRRPREDLVEAGWNEEEPKE